MFNGGKGKDRIYNNIYSEKRDFLENQYLTKDFREYDDKYKVLINENKENYVKWSAHVKEVHKNKLVLREKGFPAINARFDYNIKKYHDIKKGDIISISGYPVEYNMDLFISDWYLENCRIEDTTEDEKYLVMNYETVFEQQRAEAKKKEADDVDIEEANEVDIEEDFEELNEEDYEEEAILEHLKETAKSLKIGEASIDTSTGAVYTRKKDGFYVGEEKIFSNEELDNKESDVTLYITLQEFKEKFNVSSKNLGYNFQISSLDRKKYDNNDGFEYIFNDNIVIGGVLEGDNIFQLMTLFTPDGNREVGELYANVLIVIVNIFSPQLNETERESLFYQLMKGYDTTDINEIAGGVEVKDIRYVIKGDQEGLWFGVENIKVN